MVQGWSVIVLLLLIFLLYFVQNCNENLIVMVLNLPPQELVSSRFSQRQVRFGGDVDRV